MLCGKNEIDSVLLVGWAFATAGRSNENIPVVSANATEVRDLTMGGTMFFLSSSAKSILADANLGDTGRTLMRWTA